MTYEAWELEVPEAFKEDALWTVKAYRLSLFLLDLAHFDAEKLLKDRRSRALVDQLQRAAGSVGANIAEGYTRATGKERARFYEFSCGSAREARHWYHSARHVLGKDVVSHRVELITI